MRKSWLTYNIALAVASGGHLFGVEDWKCRPGPVVIFDNELHDETVGFRIPHVRKQMELNETIEHAVRVVTFRGHGLDLNGMATWFARAALLKPRLIILDSLYRFYPPGTNENDNGAVTQIYNLLDTYLARIPSAGLIAVCHTSKGDQSQKSLGDLAVGAGAAFRATDSQMAMRNHELEEHVVLDYQERTWAREGQLTLKRDGVVFSHVDIEPKLRQAMTAGRGPEVLPTEGRFIEALGDTWEYADVIQERIKRACGLTEKGAMLYVKQIMSRNKMTMMERNDAPVVGAGFEAMRGPGGATIFRRAPQSAL